MKSYRRESTSTILTDLSNDQQRLSTFKCILETFSHYETPKMARFESKWIGCLSLMVKLSLAIGCSYLMFQRNSYQIFDRSPISAVIIKVKQSPFCSMNSSVMGRFFNYNCTQSLFDVNDFILPATENSAVSIKTRIVEIEHILRYCNSSIRKTSQYVTSLHQCYHKSRCILPPSYRYEDENRISKQSLCWFQLPLKQAKINYQALDYIIFIKNFVEFTQLDLVRNNFFGDFITKDNLDTCEYDPKKNPLCPRFRISKILAMVENNSLEYEPMFFNGSLIEIKISWRCNLDRDRKYCKPFYEFERLDVKPYKEHPYDPGSNFLTSRHFFRPNDDELHRVHTQIYNLRIIVSVTGEVGRFDLFQTSTSIGSFAGIYGTGAIVCDLFAAFITNFKRVKYGT